MGKGLKLLIENKLHFLGPNFPTYFSHNAFTKPDNKTFHNKAINPRPATASDHLPIIISITAQAIKIPTQPKLDFIHANRENFRDDIENKLYNINTNQLMDQNVLDNSVKNCIEIVTETINTNITLKS